MNFFKYHHNQHNNQAHLVFLIFKIHNEILFYYLLITIIKINYQSSGRAILINDQYIAKYAVEKVTFRKNKNFPEFSI